MSVVRLLLAGGVLFLMGRMACRYSFNTRQAVSAVVSLMATAFFIAGLPMAFRRFRSFRVFSWVLLISSGGLLISNFRELLRPKPEREVAEWQMTQRSSRDGLVTLQVPGTWTLRRVANDDEIDLALGSMHDTFLILELHQAASNLPPTFETNAFLETVKKVYVERHSAKFGTTIPVSSVAGLPGLKVGVDCKIDGIPTRGFVFVTRSPTHFHMFLVATSPNYAELLARPVQWVEQGSIQ